MLLLIDIGNTRLKWATWEKPVNQETSLQKTTATFQQQLSTFTFGSALDYKNNSFAKLATSAWQQLPTPQRVLVANVAGNTIAKIIQDFVQQQWQIIPEFIHSSKQALGVENAYQAPQTLGVDRWLALLAAWQLFHTPVAVIDCGSAITVDVLNATGQHQGGLIVPGLTLLQQAYQSGTQNGEKLRFSPANHKAPNTAQSLGKDTQTCIELGNFYLLTHFIKGLVHDLQRQHGSTLNVLLTGGDAEMLIPHLPGEFIYRPHLVLEGLVLTAC